MPSRLAARALPLLPLLIPAIAILAGRLATHSDLAARYPRSAALLFLWLCADALALALLAKAPDNRPGLRAMLGAVAAGCMLATLAAAEPVRSALMDMRAVIIAMALTVLAYAGWSTVVAIRHFRATRSLEAALSQVLPPLQVRLAKYELAMLRLALFSWRAKPQVPQGAEAFAYHRVVNPLIASLLVLQLIEIAVVDILVSHWSRTAGMVLLALGAWGALFLVALMQGFRLYPVLIDADAVHVRSGMMIDLRIPLPAIASVGRSITDAETKDRRVLNAAILSHPNIVIELARPVTYRGLLGRERQVGRVALRLDDPAPFLAALAKKL